MTVKHSGINFKGTVEMLKLFVACGLFVSLAGACKTDIDLYASAEDVWVVYGVLRLNDSIQYFRISKVYQVEADAFVYGRENNLTVPNLRVSLDGPNGRIEASQVDTFVRDSGIFFRSQHLYVFKTGGDNRLVSGKNYQISIQSDSLPGFELKAQTRIPVAPTIQRPSLGIRTDTLSCLTSWPLEDSLRIVFLKRKPGGIEPGSFAYEIQVDIDYEERGIPRRATFGPTRPFDTSVGCGSRNGNSVCFEMPKGVILAAFETFLNTGAAGYTYSGNQRCALAPELLPEPVFVRVTAIDTMLGKYMNANNPRYVNFNTIRTEFTNISGTQRAVGIVGSTATASRVVTLSRCSESRLYLNGQRPDPNLCD